jgi:hypothetical protein
MTICFPSKAELPKATLVCLHLLIKMDDKIYYNYLAKIAADAALNLSFFLNLRCLELNLRRVCVHDTCLRTASKKI